MSTNSSKNLFVGFNCASAEVGAVKVASFRLLGCLSDLLMHQPPATLARLAGLGRFSGLGSLAAATGGAAPAGATGGAAVGGG